MNRSDSAGNIEPQVGGQVVHVGMHGESADNDPTYFFPSRLQLCHHLRQREQLPVKIKFLSRIRNIRYNHPEFSFTV